MKFSIRDLLLVTVTAALAVVVGGIWGLRSRLPSIDSEMAEQLHHSADQLSARGLGDVAESAWPAAIMEFAPKSVRVTKNGVYVKLQSHFVEEGGLFLLPTRSSFQPTAGSDPSYRQLRERIYWYEIKG